VISEYWTGTYSDKCEPAIISDFLQDQIRRDTCSANTHLTHTEALTSLCNSLILYCYTILYQQQT